MRQIIKDLSIRDFLNLVILAQQESFEIVEFVYIHNNIRSDLHSSRHQDDTYSMHHNSLIVTPTFSLHSEFTWDSRRPGYANGSTEEFRLYVNSSVPRLDIIDMVKNFATNLSAVKAGSNFHSLLHNDIDLIPESKTPFPIAIVYNFPYVYVYNELTSTLVGGFPLRMMIGTHLMMDDEAFRLLRTRLFPSDSDLQYQITAIAEADELHPESPSPASHYWKRMKVIRRALGDWVIGLFKLKWNQYYVYNSMRVQLLPIGSTSTTIRVMGDEHLAVVFSGPPIDLYPVLAIVMRCWTEAGLNSLEFDDYSPAMEMPQISELEEVD